MSGPPAPGIRLGTMLPTTILGMTAGTILGIMTAGIGVILGTTATIHTDGDGATMAATTAITIRVITITQAVGQAVAHAAWSIQVRKATPSIAAMWSMAAPAIRVVRLAGLFQARLRVVASATAMHVPPLRAPAAMAAPVAAAQVAMATPAAMAVRVAMAAVAAPASAVRAAAVAAVASADRMAAAVVAQEAVGKNDLNTQHILILFEHYILI